MKLTLGPSYTPAVKAEPPHVEFGIEAQSLADAIRGVSSRDARGVMGWLEKKGAFLSTGEPPVTNREFDEACCMSDSGINPPLRTNFHMRIMDKSDHDRAAAVLEKIRSFRKRGEK
ncbi:hypothetical protein KBD59_02165 [Candidatus Gracilibacteria bacterium]|nr:hypothetical protein [Candidatus Gracilibacteria bacterium]